jgi:hypothetical protein
VRLLLLLSAAVAASSAVAGQDVSVEDAVGRIGNYVEQYFDHAQSIVADEAVLIQTLRRDMTSEGFPRRLLYELRVEWNPEAPDESERALITRQLVTVNGRPAPPDQEPECLDPKAVSPEPLGFLLPERREKFVFTAAGTGRVDGSPAMMIDYRSVSPEPPEVEWDESCASIDLPGRMRGRIWADPRTAEVLRLDEEVIGRVDIEVPWVQRRKGASRYMTIERAHSSTRYRRVAFTEPAERYMLPASIETMNVITNAGAPRVRTTQTFGNYRRFVTASRIVR